ncbi:hypothetical protein LDENG_00269970, partial [Lucifuga dentata]
MDGRLLKAQLRIFSVLVFCLLLAPSCRGQSQLIGPSQPIVATLGDDVILPCHLEPAVDAADLTLEWTRPDLNPRFVYVRHDNQELAVKKHPRYEGRTSLFIRELNHGNVSLKLSEAKVSDEGRYRCFIPEMHIDVFVDLVVGSVSSPVISLSGIDKKSGGVVLACDANGWYPEPEVFWLDGEGRALSAGHPETLRSPDGLYAVSSRVTVEKIHGNTFTCSLRQNNINQTTETHVHVPDDFFMFQSGSDLIIIIVILSVVLVLIILCLVLFAVWKNKTKTKNNRQSHAERGSELQSLNEGGRETERPETGGQSDWWTRIVTGEVGGAKNHLQNKKKQ